ncbi:hypothetical protein, partial [Streptomyces sp. BpilaLS-43]|uniref:hypothetical protein n=1 Tax=Streptomyces sp. BpilaLS-43 TaxID=1839778 RepID=UPI001C405041
GFPVLRFRVSLSGGSNLTRLFFRSVSGPIFRSVSGPNFESDGLWIGLCLSADPTLSEILSRNSRPVRSDVHA